MTANSLREDKLKCGCDITEVIFALIDTNAVILV